MTEPATDSEDSATEQTVLWQLPVLKQFEDQRAFPHADLRTSSQVVTQDKKVVKVKCRNIGIDSVQFRTDRKGAAVIHPSGKRIEEGKGPIVLLRTQLPLGGQFKPFHATARITYVTPRDANQIAFGAEFVKVRPDDEPTLMAFIQESMRPA